MKLTLIVAAPSVTTWVLTTGFLAFGSVFLSGVLTTELAPLVDAFWLNSPLPKAVAIETTSPALG